MRIFADLSRVSGHIFGVFKHALKFIRKKSALPPLGLLTIGAMLPKEWPKKLVDVNITKAH